MAAALHQSRVIYSGADDAAAMMARHDMSDFVAQPLTRDDRRRWYRNDGAPLFDDRDIVSIGDGVYRHSSGLCFTVSSVADPGTHKRTLLVTFGGTSAGRHPHSSTFVRSIWNASNTLRQWVHNVRSHRGHETAISGSALEILAAARRFAGANPERFSSVTAHGHSLGAGVAYQTAASLYAPENPITTILVDCPPTFLPARTMRRLEHCARQRGTTPRDILERHNIHVYGRNDVAVTPAPFMGEGVAPVIARSFPLENPPGLSGVAAHNRFDEVVLDTRDPSSLPMFAHLGGTITRSRQDFAAYGRAARPLEAKVLSRDAQSQRFWQTVAPSRAQIAPPPTMGAKRSLHLA